MTDQPPRPAARRCRVLAVEDDPDVIESFTLLLEMIGNDVRAAGDGPAALDLARRFRPDIAFIDIDLPGMNGYEVANRLRREHGRTMRLFALTGFCQPADRERSLEAGFDLHLVKPVDMAFLEKLLRRPEMPAEALGRQEAAAPAARHWRFYPCRRARRISVLAKRETRH